MNEKKIAGCPVCDVPMVSGTCATCDKLVADMPVAGEVYALTGAKGTPSILAGNSWADSSVHGPSEVSEERYFDMLGCVPPERMSGGAFLVGEASMHRKEGGRYVPLYELYYERGGHYYCGGLMSCERFDSMQFGV